MSAAKHTPGPWSLHAHMGGEHTTDCSEDHGFIAHTCHIGAGDILLAEVEAYRYTSGESSGFARVSDFDECRANARLIAAAPELLEALQSAVALADKNKAAAEDEGRWVIRPPEMQRMYDACVAAIAKATGAPQ